MNYHKKTKTEIIDMLKKSEKECARIAAKVPKDDFAVGDTLIVNRAGHFCDGAEAKVLDLRGEYLFVRINNHDWLLDKGWFLPHKPVGVAKRDKIITELTDKCAELEQEFKAMRVDRDAFMKESESLKHTLACSDSALESAYKENVKLRADFDEMQRIIYRQAKQIYGGE